MEKEQEFYKEFEPEDCELEKIADQIKMGFTSGDLDNGEGRRIYWELKLNSWKED